MGESYFWKPFAQGVATPIVLIGGTNLLLKDFKVSNPYLYWGGLAASSALVVGILADKVKVPILNAEYGADYTKGYTDVTEKIQSNDKYGRPKETIVQSMKGYAGNCPSCDKRINFPVSGGGLYCYDCQVYLRTSKEKGFNKTLRYDAESFGKRDSQNMIELRKILERELPILVQQINKIEKQLKKLENGTPIEYPIENIRDNLNNMTEVIEGIHLQKIDYLGHYDAETFNSDTHTDSFMADMPVNAISSQNGGWYIPSIHRKDYKEAFKNWKPSEYPYEKRITQDSVNEGCNSCGKENVHYQFYLPRTNSVNPKMRFVDGATYCHYDTNDCGGNICGDCAEDASCENCGAEICSNCEQENNYEHSDLVCVDCREFDESLEDD